MFWNYELKFKEIDFNTERASRDFPKFVKQLSLKFLFLYNYWSLMNFEQFY